MASLLPKPLQDARGYGFEAALGVAVTVPLGIVHTMDVANVPAATLPLLAAEFGMLGPLWDTQTTDPARRSLLLSAISNWAKGGTKAGIASVLALAGWSGVTIQDVNDGLRYNGVANFDGAYDYGSAVPAWYYFRATLPLGSSMGYSILDHTRAKAIATQFAPARAILEKIVCTLAPSSIVGGAPPASGPTSIASIGFSVDGASWTTAAAKVVINGAGHIATVHAKLFPADAVGLVINKIALIQVNAAVYAQITRPASIVKASDMDLDATWTLTW